MEIVIWCGKYGINNCGRHYIAPVFGVKRFEKAKKNTNWFQKQNDKKTFSDFLKEAIKKNNLEQRKESVGN